MAIDEKLIGEVRPSESAIDRLRKRNRIRPWESALVGSPTKSKSESEGVGEPPPGQTAQRVETSEGEDREIDRTGKENPVGISPSGFSTQGVQNPESIKLRNAKGSASQLSKLPTGSSTERANHPLGVADNHACKEISEAAVDAPTGANTLSANYPGGELPSGYNYEKGNMPTGSHALEENHPVGESTPVVASVFESPAHPTQRVSDPGDSLPIGQDFFELRARSMNGFDPTPFVPPDKNMISWREKGSGELRIPHRLYEFAHRVTSTRNELLVFDCLLRFSLGFHRSRCEAGYSFIAAWTGINDITNIKKSLKTLLGAGIVVKVKEHDSASNSGSIYELPVIKGYLEYVATKKECFTNEQLRNQPIGEIPTGSPNLGASTPPAGGQETYGPVGNLPPKKENSKKTLKKTLSQEWSEDLETYVDQIKPTSKRESEIHFLGKLLSEYSSQDVTLSLRYVLRLGVLGSNEPCHSPLKYLCAAIEQVLPKARQYAILLKSSVDTSAEGNIAQNSVETDSAQDRLRAAAIAAFERELSPIEQDKYLAKVTQENSVNGYAPPFKALRSMAAMEWFEEKKMD